MQKRGLRAGVVITELFETLALFSLTNTNGLPDHPMSVLPAATNYEFASDDELRSAAKDVVRSIFGAMVESE